VLERALNELLRRHESLRTAFKVIEGAPVADRPTLRALSARNWRIFPGTPTPSARFGREIFQREARHPIDITVGPLWRNCLIREDDERHILVFTLHHIISDGWTANVAFGEIVCAL
jgi:hypothetical protein